MAAVGSLQADLDLAGKDEVDGYAGIAFVDDCFASCKLRLGATDTEMVEHFGAELVRGPRAGIHIEDLLRAQSTLTRLRTCSVVGSFDSVSH